MCGIVGIINRNGSPAKEIPLRKMLTAIVHRGPDENGIAVEGHVGLGHARLSIIDLSGGRQPMSNEDGTLTITFNGEIFNYIELRKELEKSGRHKFSTNSDTEVILHLYEDLGDKCLSRLNGQFAFAIWDSKKRELFAARDRMGIRPFFYAETGGKFIFSSEIKAIFAEGSLNREVDPISLDEIFSFWCTIPPRTAFKNICELPPAHFLTLKSGIVRTEQYWDIDYLSCHAPKTFEETSEELLHLLKDALRLQLRADVPIGAYLSGGLDSSVTVALLKEVSNTPFHTFSIAFEDASFDESRYQNEISAAFETEHHKITCSYRDIAESFPDVIWHAEKPVIRTAPAPLYLLSALVKEKGLKIVLTGEGSDEIFGGYDIFKEAKIRQFWGRQPGSEFRPLLLKRLYPYLPAFQGQSNSYRQAFFGAGISQASDPFFSHRPRWQTVSKGKLFFSERLKEEIGSSSIEEGLKRAVPAGFENWGALERAQYLEAKVLLPGYILSSQGDRMAMANSIEARFPFLDHRLVEFAARMPFHYKMRGLNEKAILKHSMKKRLPESILKRTKQPYMAPDSKCFFSEAAPGYVKELLSESCLKEFGYFEPRLVRMLMDKCERGGVIGLKDNMALVGILSTQILHQKFIKDFSTGQSEPAEYKETSCATR